MALHLVTGYKGKPHITSADQGVFNAGLVGSRDYVLTSGNNLKAQLISNNIIRIYDGDILMQGRHINLKANTYDDVEISNGIQAMNRNDIIAIRYSKDMSTGIENAELVVIQGVSTNDAAKDPKLTTGDLLNGDIFHEMPLYRVCLSGLNISTVEPIFTLIEPLNSTNSVISDKFDSNLPYAVGDYCIYDNALYKFKNKKEAGEWDESVVEVTTVGAELSKQSKNIANCFQSVSDGKALVASAITDKRVPTDAAATFAQMAANILKIVLGSGNALPEDVKKGKTFTNDDGVEYTGTYDFAKETEANATAALITKGYTAWVNGELVVGTRALPVNSQSGSVGFGKVTWGNVVDFTVNFPTQFDTTPTVTLAGSTVSEHVFDQLKVLSVNRSYFTGRFEPGGTPDMGWSEVVIRWTAST